MSKDHGRDELFAYLKEIGYSVDMKTLYKRKRVQKIVYVLQSFLKVFHYRYTWYIYGPYSS